MDFDWKKWFEFGVKASLIWDTLLAVIIVSFMGFLMATFGFLFGTSLAPVFAGLVAFGIIGLGVAILVNAVLWILVGYLYEMEWADMFKKLPIWAQLSVINVIAAYVVSLATGGSATLVLIALIIPLLVVGVLGAVITNYLFEFFDWDMPFVEER
jgi:hypothetical protein